MGKPVLAFIVEELVEMCSADKANTPRWVVGEGMCLSAEADTSGVHLPAQRHIRQAWASLGESSASRHTASKMLSSLQGMPLMVFVNVNKEELPSVCFLK